MAVLAIEQLSRHCQQPPRRVLRSGYVLGMGSVQRLHHLDAEASIVREEHRELGMGLWAGSVMLAGWGKLYSSSQAIAA